MGDYGHKIEEVKTMKNEIKGLEDGDETGGSRVNFPLHTGETPSLSTEEES